MANNVKFSTGLKDDLLKRNSDNSYVHKIENGHVYFTTRENDEGETIGSIFYDVNGKRVSMGGGVAEQAKSDDMKQNIADTYVTRISSEGAKYASTDGVTLTTYNGRNAILDTILLPVAGSDRAGVVITGAQTFAGNKTFTGIIHLTNTRDADGGSDSGVLIIGNKDGSHLIFDDNEIMAKNKTNGTSVLYLNADGGAVCIGGNLLPNGATKTLSIGSATAYWKEAYIGNVVTDTISGHLTGSLTGNVTGNATSATKLQTARKIILGNDLQGEVSFDGTKDVTFTASSYYASIGGGNTQNYPWRRIATTGTVTSDYVDKDIVIAIRHSYNGGGYGIAKVSLRANQASAGATANCEVRWLIRQNIAHDSLQAGFRNTAKDTYVDLFYKVGTWPRAKVYQLQGDRSWTLISSTEADNTTTSDKKTSSEAYATIAAAATALGRTYTSTIQAYDQGYVERAYKDESGNNIKESYLASIQQVTSDKDTFTFRGFNKNNGAMNNLITVPAATASGTDNTKWKAGLVTSQAQQWAGTKTFRDNIVISHATTSTVGPGATNPHIRFEEYEGTQPVYLMYNDHDVYRSPAGLKVVGDPNKTSSKAWFEIEGDLIVGTKSTLGGDLTITGNIMPSKDITYTLGDNNYKWLEMHTKYGYIFETLYVNRCADGTKGGIALYSTSAPTTYGIAMRTTGNQSTHGYVTSDWATYFSMDGANTRGWIFKQAGTNVASINGQGYAHLNKLCLNRNGNAAYGRISWYNKDFYTWYDYMSNSEAGAAPTGGKPSQMGSVTSWARRSLIESVANYGWIWESTNNAAAGSTSATPTPRMALASDTGRLYLSNDLMIMMGDTDKFVHYLYANGAGATNYVGASWRAGVLGSGSANTNYYVIQSGTSSTASTTWENAVRIGQNNYDFTVGTTTKGGIGVANTSNSTGNGISLYGGAMPNSDGTAKSGKPTYGLFFGGTGTFGKHGGVQGDWATYFTMDSTANRGWVFLKGETAVASINNDGITKLGDGSGATASSAGSDTGALRVVGGISTTKNSYFNEKITFPENKIALEFSSRDTWKAGIIYDTNGHEALVIAMQNPRTSFIVADNTDPNAWTGGTWPSKTPIIQAKKGALYINKLFNGDPSYNLHVEGTANITGNVTMGGTLEVTSTTKIKQGSAATAINTGALQVTGGLSTTAASYMNGALTVNSTINATGNITAPRFIGLADEATAIAQVANGNATTAITGAPGTGKIRFYYNVNIGIAGLFPANNNANSIITINKHGGNYDSQLGFSSDGNIYYRSFNGSALNNTTGWQMLLTTANAFNELDGRYVNVSGDSMTGHLNALNGLSWNHAYWSPNGNIYCQPTANGQEWSIDVGSASYTGCYWHVWSSKNSKSMIRCDVDNNAVSVPNGTFTASGGNAYFTQTIVCSAQIGNYGEGIRINCNDGQWATITMGSTGDTGTRANCWSIHRKADNNFCISRQSSDGANGLVMTGTGMGLGTVSPGARLHVIGNFFVDNGHARFYTPDAGTSPGAAAIEIREVGLASSGGTHSVAYAPRLGFHWGNRYWGQIAFFNSEFQFRSSDVNSYCAARASAFWGAVWNDYAEYRKAETLEAGRVVIEDKSGEMKLSTERLQPGANVVSDTFGFAIGETDDCKTPLAVAGRVLAYPYEDRDSYPLGAAVCSGPNGTVSLMTREEIREYPERIIGTVSEIPTYEVWGDGNAPINGRIWIKVR